MNEDSNVSEGDVNKKPGILQTDKTTDEPVDSVSGQTFRERVAFDEFIYGPGYDRDPYRRYMRLHGGHCSGGGGPC